MNDSRKISFDILRIILMFLIILGHLFVHTGIRTATEFLSFKWNIAWSFQAIAICAVNCFILLTGYFMSTKQFKLIRVLKLWGRVFLYSALIYTLLLVFKIRVFSTKDLIISIFPVSSSTYWFFTCYIVLFFLMPFINIIISKVDKEQCLVLNIVIIICFFIYPVLSFYFPPLDNTSGMGIIQFVCLYCIGASIRKYDLILKKRWCIVLLFFSVLLVFFSKILLENIARHMNLDVGTSLFYHNNNILQLINAFLLFLLFKQFKFKQSKYLNFSILSSIVFSVYIIHDNPFIREILWGSWIRDLLINCNNLLFVVYSVIIPLAILIGCMILDLIRYIFGFLISKFICKTKGHLWFVNFLTKIDSLINGMTFTNFGDY